MATHSSMLAWRIPRTEEPGELRVHGAAKSRTRPKRLSTSAVRLPAFRTVSAQFTAQRGLVIRRTCWGSVDRRKGRRTSDLFAGPRARALANSVGHLGRSARLREPQRPAVDSGLGAVTGAVPAVPASGWPSGSAACVHSFGWCSLPSFTAFREGELASPNSPACLPSGCRGWGLQ